MPLQRWTGSAFVDVSTLKRWNGSAWVDISTAQRWNGSSWVAVTLPGGSGAISATASRSSVSGTVTSAALIVDVTSSSVTITTTGGTAPYTYAWSQLSGDAAIAADTVDSDTTTFTATVSKDDALSGTFRCTVTDSLGAIDTVDVGVTLIHNGPSPTNNL